MKSTYLVLRNVQINTLEKIRGRSLKKLYETNELLFTAIIVIADLLLYEVGKELSFLAGIAGAATAPIRIFEIVFLYLWISKNGMKEKYGFCSFKKDINKYLYLFPLIVLIAIIFVRGIHVKFTFITTIIFIIIQIGIAFMEELIYRCFLFRALCKKMDAGVAVVISSVIFGAIHMSHLLCGEDLLVNVLHVLYAGAVGFLFCVIFYEGKSIWPCIITHALINSCEAFVKIEITLLNYWGICAVTILFSYGWSLYILKKEKSCILTGIEEE